MEDNQVTDTTTTSEGTDNNVVVNAGKSFTQEHLDSIIKSRLNEQKTKLEQRFTTDLEVKIKEARDLALADLDKQVQDRIAARDAEIALNHARATIAQEYNLDEVQSARLSGTTVEELKSDAELLFGKFRPKVEPDEVLQAARTALIEELGLTEKQAMRLTGNTAEELRSDAIELYGIKDTSPRKPPVLLNGGSSNTIKSLLDNIENMSPAEIRKAGFLAHK